MFNPLREHRVVCLVAGVFFLACAAAGVRGQTGPELILKPWPKEQALEVGADALFLDGGHLQRSDESFHLSAYETTGRVRLFPGDLISPRVGFQLTYLDLDTENPALPRQLVDQSVAIAMPIGRYEDWIFAASAGVGYAGPTPFGDGDAYYGKGTLAAFRELDQGGALVFVLDYDRNRAYLPDVPLPGFAYTRQIDPTFLLIVGVPVTSLQWKPNDRFTLKVSYLLVDRFDASAEFELFKGVKLYGNLEQLREGFFLDGLKENYDRMLFEQRRAEVGVRWQPREEFDVYVAGGYAWGGEFSTGFDFRKSTLVADISDEPYVRAGIELRF